MFDWALQSRSRVCAVTGRSFVDLEPCHTLLFEKKHGYDRLDLCKEAWEKDGPEIVSRPGLISHWRGEYHAPPPAQPEAIRKDDAEGLLRHLVGLREERYASACFILAAMLERKRMLKVRSQVHENGRRVWVYEHTKTGDVIAIPDPALRLDQLENVQREVADLLSNGLPASRGVPVTAADGSQPAANPAPAAAETVQPSPSV
jgi:hypothetical protein